MDPFVGSAVGTLWSLLTFALAFRYGRYTERVAWNKLIQEGKIPKPKKNITTEAKLQGE
jgi:hypothetical protein